MVLPRVLYWSHAPSSVYELIRACSDGVASLVTLDADSQAEREARLLDADALIVAATPLRATDLAHAPSLKLVHHQGVGYQDTVPLDALARRGIRLACTPEGTTIGVAEHTIMLMLAACKRLPHVDSELREGRWHVNTYRGESREISGMTIGYLGFGRIGQAVAERLQGFGALAIYHDPMARVGPALSAAARPVSLADLLRLADVVSLHLPLTGQTRHILDAAALSTMKKGAIVVNASRGGLLDEAALANALRSGHLGGAALDCFEQEPPATTHPLFKLNNVVVSPHCAAATVDALKTKMKALFANIRRWQRGEPLRNEVPLQHETTVNAST